MNVKQKLIDALETICPDEVYLQGTLTEDEDYPESFITFWTDFTDDNSFYDDNVHAVDWNFSVIFYSSSPALVGTKPDEIRAALKAAGFIPQGKGQDIPSDRPSHTGWAMEYIYKEIIKKGD